jgi:hypothetical protein
MNWPVHRTAYLFPSFSNASLFTNNPAHFRGAIAGLPVNFRAGSSWATRTGWRPGTAPGERAEVNTTMEKMPMAFLGHTHGTPRQRPTLFSDPQTLRSGAASPYRRPAPILDVSPTSSRACRHIVAFAAAFWSVLGLHARPNKVSWHTFPLSATSPPAGAQRTYTTVP